MSETIYYCRQRATVILASLAAGVLVVAAAALVSHPGVWAIGVVLLAVGYLFSSLTILVDEEAVRWYFGPGFWRSSVKLSEIESVGPVRNRWWYGWGIRYTPHGWLYNVAGLDAVEFRLTSGRKFRLGTEEPEQLARTVESALPSNRGG
jgi:hypothetical protein